MRCVYDERTWTIQMIVFTCGVAQLYRHVASDGLRAAVQARRTLPALRGRAGKPGVLFREELAHFLGAGFTRFRKLVVANDILLARVWKLIFISIIRHDCLQFYTATNILSCRRVNVLSGLHVELGKIGDSRPSDTEGCHVAPKLSKKNSNSRIFLN